MDITSTVQVHLNSGKAERPYGIHTGTVQVHHAGDSRIASRPDFDRILLLHSLPHCCKAASPDQSSGGQLALAE